jgi:hypothetical protein
VKRTVEIDVVLLSAPSLGAVLARRKRARLRRAAIEYFLLWPAAMALVMAVVFILAAQR